MTKPLIYFFADHHAGGGYPGRGIDDSAYSLDQIIKRAIKDKVEWVISLGDAVNTARTHADAPVPLRNQLARLPEAGVKFGYVDGNHDKRNVSWLAGPYFTHLDHNPIDVGGHIWMGLDFATREVIQRQLAEEVPGDVTGLVMHQAWSDFINFDDVPQCSFFDVPPPVVRVATGDYHGESVVRQFRRKDGQKIVVCNPGSTSMQNIVEPGEKNFAAFLSDGSFKLIPLLTRPVLQSDVIVSATDFEKFLSEVRTTIEMEVGLAAERGLPEELRRPLLRVNYSHSLSEVVRRVEKVVGDRAHLFWNESKPEKVKTTFKVNLESYKGDAFTPQSMLKEEINPDDPADPLAGDAYFLAEMLLAAKDKADVKREAHRWLAVQMEGD